MKLFKKNNISISKIVFVCFFIASICSMVYANPFEDQNSPDNIPANYRNKKTNAPAVNEPAGRPSFGTVNAQRPINMPSDDTMPHKYEQKITTSQDKNIDLLDLKQMEVTDVLKLISQKTGLNIIASQNVNGRVTVYLKNVGAEEALRIIVDAYGWAYAKEGGIIKVMTMTDYEAKYGYKFGEQKTTKIEQLVFVSSKDVVDILNQIKSNTGTVISDDKSNSVILIDSENKIQQMLDIIKNIDAPVSTEVFDLSYAKAEDISKQVMEVLTPEVGSMKFDVRSNKIIVSDTVQKLKKIRDIIDAFDQKHKEVLIEAKIVQIALTDEHKMGVNWEAIVNDYHSMNLGSNFDVLGATEKKGKISIGTISSDDYSFLLEALETVGVTDILSSPHITTINNEEAKILVGLTEPYVTTTTTTPSSGPTTTAETVEFIEVGVKLYVTPTIHNDGFITMKIRPEVSSVVDNVTTSNNNVIPVVETSEAETNVVVKDQVTIVIGGLIKEEKIKSTKKVPLLGDLPLLGHAFKNESELVKKTEIVIFLKPTIITGDVEQSSELF